MLEFQVHALVAQSRLGQLAGRAAWVVPLALVGGGFVLGLIVDKVIFRYLRKLAQRTPWEADDIIIHSLRNMPLLWLTLAGAWGAVSSIELVPRWEELARKTLLVIFVLSLTLVAARVAAGMVALYSLKSEGLLPSTTIFRNLTAAVVYGIGLLIVLDTLGVSIAPILTALGVGGLAVALALQDTLSNLFAGIQIIASRQVRVGDYIKLSSGEEGYVTDIRWRNTTIRALPNNMILVPNSKLASTITTNYYMPEKEMSVGVTAAVAYGSDLEQVERVTLEVARQTLREVPGGVATYEPSLRYNRLADSSIQFSVNLRGKEFTDQYLLTHEFLKRLYRRYQQEGIEIPFPVRTVYLKGTEERQRGAGAGKD